jgi:myo-inositol-1(or 4)-monophosphatase
VTALLDLVASIADDAAELALTRRREGVSVAATKSSPVDVVTAADREVEAYIRGRVAAERPGDGFLGEESAAATGTSGLTWVVDPIDGTVNFLYDIPRWAVSVAVVEGGTDPATWRILAGCVVNPSTGEAYAAESGGGATLNGAPIEVSDSPSLAQSLVATGFGYDADRRREQAASVQRLIGEVRDIRRLGAASLDLCSVACGQIDLYYERGLSPWDFAAGALIAAEAGAVVEVADVREGRRLVTAAPRGLAPAFAELVRVSGA